MKKVLNLLFIVSCLLVGVSCSDDNKDIVDELTLDKTSVEVVEDAAAAVTVKTGNGTYTATPADTTVATTTVSGNTITVTGITAGTTIVNVTDAKGKSTSFTVRVTSKYTAPETEQFNWNGTTVSLAASADQWSIASYTNRVVLTSLSKKIQYILSWTGDLSYGKKAGGILQIVGTGAGTNAGTVTLTNLEVVKAESGNCFITFEAGKESGEFYFAR